MKKSGGREIKKTAGKIAGERPVKAFPMVGIGASAGGIEAITLLLENLSADNGMAYVIVQHLSPSRKSILPEIFNKKTSMPVHSVQNGMEVHPDNVYVIPSNTMMGIVDGHLTLSPREKTDTAYHPIDHFFIGMATVYQNRALGIILSGTATDGTAGLQAIKSEGGITFAQDSSAKFEGMPRNAFESGQVDFLLSPQEIAKELATIAKSPYVAISAGEKLKENELRKILGVLYNKWDVDFSLYKQSTIHRRILRRVTLKRLKGIDEYTTLLKNNEAELALLYNDLLINVTNFFRDPAVFRALSKKIFPALVKGREANDTIRMWIPACSTGDEAYSIAICMFEYLSANSLTLSFQVFATDLNELAIEKARTGVYQKSLLEHISAARLKKYFVPLDGHYQVIKAIRDACVFSRHNLLTDPPFSRMDIVSCQNLLIYLEPASQKVILQSFYYSVKTTGYLILGKSESALSTSELFEQIDKNLKIFSKKEGIAFPSFHFHVKTNQGIGGSENGREKKIYQLSALNELEKDTDKILLGRYTPPALVVNKDLQILRFYGHTSDYLQPAPGKASLQLLKMVKDELLFELRKLIQQVKKQEQAARKERISFTLHGSITEIDIEVVPIRPASKEPYYLILFRQKESAARKAGSSHTNKKLQYSEEKNVRISGLEDELRDAREQIKSISEEFESTREELQTSNEEVLSSNEELQSINEELETSKEELQSTNEELVTINDELNLRNNEIREALEYREAIVETIREPLVVLSPDLRILTVNKAFNQLFKTTAEDAKGVFFQEILNGQWNVSLLKKKLKEVGVKNKNFQDFEITGYFPHMGERLLLCSALLMEKKNQNDNKILLVIEDISERRNAEENLKKSNELNLDILNSITDIFITLDNNWKFTFVNRKAERFIGKNAANILHKNIWEVLPSYAGTSFSEKLHQSMQTKIAGEFDFFDQASRQWFHHRLYPSGQILSIYSNNITEQKLSVELVQQSRERYRTFISKSTEGIWRFEVGKPISVKLPANAQVKHLLKDTYLAECNDYIARMYGYENAKEIIGKSLGEVYLAGGNANYLSRFVAEGYRLTDMETHEINKKGEEKYFLHNLVGIIDNGEIRRIWGTQRNVTEHKQALLLLLETQQKLNLALSAGSVSIWLWNIQTGELKWTKEQLTLYGLKAENQPEKFKDWLNLVHTGDVLEVQRAIENAVLLKTDLSIEFRILWPDGSIRWLVLKAGTSYDADNNPSQMSGVNIDITDRKMIERQKEEFIGIASHELKTPVTSIKVYTEILHESLLEKNDHKSAELVTKMEIQVDRLTNLIKDLLDVTRISGGQLQLHPGYFDLEKLVGERIEEVQRTSAKHRIDRKINITRQVWGDKNKIGEVLTNLLSNAIKYSPAADKVIVTAGEDERGMIIVSVKDFGIGLSDNIRQKIFERFFRVNDPTVNTFPGLGLGLFICAEIIKKHHGKIWVESKVNEGSEFFFTLPERQ